SFKDQIYFHNGALTEAGFAASREFTQASPQGTQIFEILPTGARGNYFENLTQHADRTQFLSNTYLPAIHGWGEHRLRFGADIERSGFDQSADRHAYRVLRQDFSVARNVEFFGNGFTSKTSMQAAEYIEDRWAPANGVLIDAGARADWDDIVHKFQISPRLGAVYAPKWLGGMKLSAGIGMFHDAL